MFNKTYHCMSTEDIYENYKQAVSKDKFIQGVIENLNAQGIKEKGDFFNLLLSEAIQHNDNKLVEHILKLNDKDFYPALLTSVDKIQMSPLAYVLLLDETDEIKDTIKESLNHGYRFPKITLTKEAFIKMYEIIGYQGESYQEYINDFIKPIITEEEVSMLGEPVFENLDFSSVS